MKLNYSEAKALADMVTQIEAQAAESPESEGNETMNRIIKSWRCSKCQREEFFSKPKDRHFTEGELCKDGEWLEYDWRRGTKLIVHKMFTSQTPSGSVSFPVKKRITVGEKT